MLALLAATAAYAPAVASHAVVNITAVRTPHGGDPQQSHYGDPKDGCRSDEVEVDIEGVAGAFCTSTCDFFTVPPPPPPPHPARGRAREWHPTARLAWQACPHDTPEGFTAEPECVLEDETTGRKYCALVCGGSNRCGDRASCKNLLTRNIGLCTYDDAAPPHARAP